MAIEMAWRTIGKKHTPTHRLMAYNKRTTDVLYISDDDGDDD